MTSRYGSGYGLLSRQPAINMLTAAASRPSTIIKQYREGMIFKLLEVGIMVAVVRAGVVGIALRLWEHMGMGEAP